MKILFIRVILQFQNAKELTKVSLITVTYNSAKTLQSCIDSVSSQSYKDLEHIVVDGLSTDDTLTIIKSNLSISKFISEKDSNLYDAMNKGLKMASGDLIGILNSDDIFNHKDVIKNMVNRLGESDAVYADLLYVKENDLNHVVRYWKSGEFKRDSFLKGWMPPHPTLFVKKESYQKHGNFLTYLNNSADYELMLRFFFKNKLDLSYNPEVTVRMRVGGVSNSSLSARINANREDRLAWKINKLQVPFFLPVIKPLRKVNQYFKKWS